MEFVCNFVFKNWMLNLTTMSKIISKPSCQACTRCFKESSKAFIRLIALCVNFLLILLWTKILLFMPKYHCCKILVGVSPYSLPTSALTTHMTTLPIGYEVVLWVDQRLHIVEKTGNWWFHIKDVYLKSWWPFVVSSIKSFFFLVNICPLRITF